MTTADPDIIETESIRLLAQETRAMAAVDAAAKAQKLRNRAEECRTLPQTMTAKVNTAFYLDVAEIL